MSRWFETYPERGAIGDTNGQVGKNGKEPVCLGAAKGEVVGDFVDGEKQILIRGRANHVGYGPELEGPERCRLKHVREADLEGHDGGNEIFGEWFGAAELGDL